MKKRTIEGILYYNIKNNKFLILEGVFDNYVIINELEYICHIEIKYIFGYYTLRYILSKNINYIYEKYKHITNDVIFNLLYLENNKILLQDNVIEFKNIQSAFQKDGKGIIDIDGSLHNLHIIQN